VLEKQLGGFLSTGYSTEKNSIISTTDLFATDYNHVLILLKI
jgi:hypothetical protein